MNNTKHNQQQDMKSAIKTYFKGVKSEWGKITWPQKPQIVGETIIVLIVVAFVSAVVYIVDIGFKWLFHLLKLT